MAERYPERERDRETAPAREPELDGPRQACYGPDADARSLLEEEGRHESRPSETWASQQMEER
jgi:hypothetical protein